MAALTSAPGNVNLIKSLWKTIRQHWSCASPVTWFHYLYNLETCCPVQQPLAACVYWKLSYLKFNTTLKFSSLVTVVTFRYATAHLSRGYCTGQGRNRTLPPLREGIPLEKPHLLGKEWKIFILTLYVIEKNFKC